MDKKLILDFLRDLSNNNSKEWMDKNRDRYNEAKNIWLNEVGLYLNRYAKYDPKLKHVLPKDTITRINNNRRFHPDKPIYKDNFTFTPYHGIASASIHISLSPNYSFIGGGLYHPYPAILAKVRDAIDYNGNVLLDIVNDKKYVNIYGGLEDDPDQLKSAPKGFDKDHQYIELLRRKNFISRFSISSEQFISDEFVDLAEKAFVIIKPLLDYLNTAIEFEE